MNARPKAKKEKTAFQCRECGGAAPKWSGQCPECLAWNTLEEVRVRNSGGGLRLVNYADDPAVQDIGRVAAPAMQRIASGMAELDRVLGGGLVAGSVVLLGGDPGIGKSTILLQALGCIADAGGKALYLSGEESAEQIALRARRLELGGGLRLLCENRVERVLALAEAERPAVLVVDSIQAMMTEALQSAPGSVAQVRESAAALVRYAKQTGCVVVLVGHVTKDGQLAGPRLLEHVVDAVLYFEGDRSTSFRLIRGIKNRYGALNEIGVFAMTDRGLKEVGNPSAMFIQRHPEALPGSVIFATREGTRPLLAEVQALVDKSAQVNPRRLAVGLEPNRLAMVLAVLQRMAGCPLYDRDVFTNIVGGIRVGETGADLALALAIYSSFYGRPLADGTVVFGELGLAGEIRPVQGGQERLKEAQNLGFTRAVVPKANAPKKSLRGLTVVAVGRVGDALEVLS